MEGHVPEAFSTSTSVAIKNKRSLSLSLYDFAGLSLPRFTTPGLELVKSYVTASASVLFVFVEDLAKYDFAAALPV